MFWGVSLRSWGCSYGHRSFSMFPSGISKYWIHLRREKPQQKRNVIVKTSKPKNTCLYNTHPWLDLVEGT